MHACIMSNLIPNIYFGASNLHVPAGTSFGVIGNCISFSEIHWEVSFLGDDELWTLSIQRGLAVHLGCNFVCIVEASMGSRF